MLDVHAVTSELDESYEPEIVTANIYHPPLVFVFESRND